MLASSYPCLHSSVLEFQKNLYGGQEPSRNRVVEPAGRYNNSVPTRFLACIVLKFHRARIFQLLGSPKNRFQGINSASLCNLTGRYDNLIPTRFLAPVDCLKIPAQFSSAHCGCKAAIGQGIGWKMRYFLMCFILVCNTIFNQNLFAYSNIKR